MLDQLRQIAPPFRPIKSPLIMPDWASIQAELGATLPPDYKALVETYGSGRFAAEFFVFAAGDPDLPPYQEWVKEVLGRYPEAMSASTNDLLPCGWAADLSFICWRTAPRLEDWAIVIVDPVTGRRTEEYQSTLTEVLVRWLSGDYPAGHKPSVAGFVPFQQIKLLVSFSVGLRLGLYQAFPRNRYKPQILLEKLDRVTPTYVDGAWRYELCAGEDNEDGRNQFDWGMDDNQIDIIVEGSEGGVADYRPLIMSFLEQLGNIDNLVQEHFESEAFRTSSHVSEFLVDISQITLSDDQATICYWGISVNQGWDAKFERDENGFWRKINF